LRPDRIGQRSAQKRPLVQPLPRNFLDSDRLHQSAETGMATRTSLGGGVYSWPDHETCFMKC
jgi:hypothetical protein